MTKINRRINKHPVGPIEDSKQLQAAPSTAEAFEVVRAASSSVDGFSQLNVYNSELAC